MDEITIKKKDLEILAKEGGKWILSKEGEEYIEKLTILQDWLDEAMEETKARILECVKKNNPDLTTIRGKKHTAFIRGYGDKYIFTVTPEFVNKEFAQEIKYIRPDFEAIRGYKNKYGKLPEGTIEKPQEIKVVFVKNKKPRI